MIVNKYDIGDVVHLFNLFTQNGFPVDPGEVTLQIKTPGNVITSFTYGNGQVIRERVGSYYYDYQLPDESGTYYYRYSGTPPGEAAKEYSFTVNTTQF